MVTRTGNTFLNTQFLSTMAGALAFFLSPNVAAGVFNVSTAADAGAGSLRKILEEANSRTDTPHTININLSAGDSINLATQLPVIQKDMTIVGPTDFDLVIRGGGTRGALGNSAPFFIYTGTVSISNISIENGVSLGGTSQNTSGSGGGGGLGAGGAVFVGPTANVTLTDVNLINNIARGGDGGSVNLSGVGTGAGGGGLLKGHGGGAGTLSETGGGGGGGVGGTGGRDRDGRPTGGVGLMTAFPATGGRGGPHGDGERGADGGANAGGGGIGGSIVGANAGGGGGGGGRNDVSGRDGGTGSGVNGGAGGRGGFGGGGGGGAAGLDTGRGGNGGSGGFGGGGGAGGDASGTEGTGGNGGAGGFGGGGGGAGAGATPGTAGVSDFGGGAGGAASSSSGGGGGAGFGGGVFVASGGSLKINTTGQDTNFTGNGVVAGSGGTGFSSHGTSGQAAGEDLYLMSGTAAVMEVAASRTQTLNGSIAGAGGLIKQGPGSLVLLGMNKYTGGTTVNAGILRGNIQSLQGPIVNNAELIFDQGGSGDFDGAISGTGSVTKSGNHTISFSDNNTYSGGTKVLGGILSIDIDNALSTTGALSVSNNATFELARISQTVSSLSGNGNITLKGDEATLRFASTITGITDNFSGRIRGEGSVVKIGNGLANLTGQNDYEGTTNIEAGRLNLSGTVRSNSAMTIASNAALSGTGSIGHGTATVTNAGHLAPGEMDAIGTLSIEGSYTQAATGHLDILLDPNTADLLSLTRTATINGGSLNITPGIGTYAYGKTYIIVNAPRGVTGTFGNVLVNNTYTGGAVNVRYLPTAIRLELFPDFKAVGLLPNAANLVQYLNQLNATERGQLMTPLVKLSALSNEAFSNALEELAGTKSIGTLTAVQEVNSAIHFVNGRRLAFLREFQNRGLSLAPYLQAHDRLGFTPQSQRFSNRLRLKGKASSLGNYHAYSPQYIVGGQNGTGVWVDAFGHWLEQTSKEAVDGFVAKTAGAYVAADYSVFHNFFLGIGFGQYITQLDWSENGGRADINSQFLTAYTTWSASGFYCDASIVSGVARYAVNRHIQYPGISVVASNAHNGRQLSSHLGLGYSSYFYGLFIAEPFLQFDLPIVRENGYTEYGAGALNLQVQAKRASSLRSELGFNIYEKMYANYFDWSPRVRFSYINKSPRQKGQMTGGFAGLPGSFTVGAFDKTQHVFSPGAGILMNMGSRAYLSLWYVAELGTQAKSQEVNLKALWHF